MVVLFCLCLTQASCGPSDDPGASNGASSSSGGLPPAGATATGTTGAAATTSTSAGSGTTGVGGASGTDSTTAPGSTGMAGATSSSTSGGVMVNDGLFSIATSLSPEIATVGIVDWTVSMAIDSAYIEFGRDPNSFEFQAPVDDASSETHRTLLLGMKEGQTYAARIVAQSGGNSVASEVFTLETGFLSNSLPGITVNDTDASQLFGGFTITCNGFQNAQNAGVGGQGGGASFVFIIDADGDVVWAYETTDTVVNSCSAARFSYDGKHVWIGNFSNVDTDGALMRVTLDGLENEIYSLPARHHHFTVLPDNAVLYYEQGNGGGYDEGGGIGGGGEGEDIIMRLDPETGQTTVLYDQNTHFQQQIDESGAHTNYITYVPHLNAISFSLRHTDTIALMSYPAMELLAVFGGPEQVNTFGINWDAQHGHHFYDNRLLIFNNNDGGSGARVIEFEYDIQAGTATELSSYDAGISSVAFGDVQRLANGNMLVTYSIAGVFHEVSASGQLLREMVSADPIGYARRRLTLYGPPPPFAD